MTKKRVIEQILENAKKIQQKNDLIKENFKKRDVNRQTWEKACANFHSTYDQLAFPEGLENGINLLKKKRPPYD